MASAALKYICTVTGAVRHYCPKGHKHVKQFQHSFVRAESPSLRLAVGAGPLYKFEVNQPALVSMAGIIKAEGLKVRIITRELQNVTKLKGIADYVSIYLDSDVLSVLGDFSPLWGCEPIPPS